jgi:uncharacterized metal-binding protein YceD (DUF177 family)
MTEFSRPIRLDTLGPGARRIEIVAEPAERAALKQRFGLLGVDMLTAWAEVTREGEAAIAVGALKASVTQACVASGEPVPAKIVEDFALRFVPESSDAPADEIELDATDLDEIAYSGSSIDLGEAVAQTLALALDPFPRAPNADDALRAAGVVGEEDVGPFSALKGLRDRLGG